LTLDGTDGATTTGGVTADGAVQSGETATININSTFEDALAVDVGETLDAAVNEAINIFNDGNTAGDPGTFSYLLGVITFTGDGVQTNPTLTIDLDTNDDSLIEGDEDFTVAIANPSGSVASQASFSETDNSVTTTINDNDLVTFSIDSDINTVAEGDDVTLTISLVGKWTCSSNNVSRL